MIGDRADLFGEQRLFEFRIDDTMIRISDDVDWVQVLPHVFDFSHDHRSIHDDAMIRTGQTLAATICDGPRRLPGHEVLGIDFVHSKAGKRMNDVWRLRSRLTISYRHFFS